MEDGDVHLLFLVWSEKYFELWRLGLFLVDVTIV